MRRIPLYSALVLGLGASGWALASSRPSGAVIVRSGPVRETRPVGATILERFDAPAGFERVPAEPNSFTAYLRDVPLRPPGTEVRLFDRRPKKRQDVHAAVLDLDVGTRDLQQCADAVMRLRAEYLHAAGRMDEIEFHFTSGFRCGFRRWRIGARPRVQESDVEWVDGAAPDDGHASLRRYLDVVFAYAGTRSLPRDLVRAQTAVEPGDVYLQSGSPGHAMIVMDVVVRGPVRAMLLAQGYMPAQDVHLVKNLEKPHSGAWFVEGEGDRLVTPEWTFPWTSRWRFPAARRVHDG